jgi:endonuclease/exonuclease/phosphatase family metal-dependent hydrolase
VFGILNGKPGYTDRILHLTSGIYDFEIELSITYDEAKSISDHLPVWATFKVDNADYD